MRTQHTRACFEYSHADTQCICRLWVVVSRHHDVTGTENKYIRMYYMNQAMPCAAVYAPGRRCVCIHQMAALFCVKWRHGRNLESMTSYPMKSDIRQSVHTYLENNRAKFNFDPIWNDGALGFLQRVSIACYVKRCISYRKSARLSVRLSVCLSVCHTLALCQNDSSYDHGVFTVG